MTTFALQEYLDQSYRVVLRIPELVGENISWLENGVAKETVLLQHPDFEVPAACVRQLIVNRLQQQQ